MSQTINKDELKKTIVFNVKSIYRKTIDEATPAWFTRLSHLQLRT